MKTKPIHTKKDEKELITNSNQSIVKVKIFPYANIIAFFSYSRHFQRLFLSFISRFFIYFAPEPDFDAAPYSQKVSSGFLRFFSYIFYTFLTFLYSFFFQFFPYTCCSRNVYTYKYYRISTFGNSFNDFSFHLRNTVFSNCK